MWEVSHIILLARNCARNHHRKRLKAHSLEPLNDYVTLGIPSYSLLFNVTQNEAREGTVLWCVSSRYKKSLLAFFQGLVIFNPAIGGWSRDEGVKNIWRPVWGGLKIFCISFEGRQKFPHCLSNTFYIKCRGSKFFHFTREGGQTIFFLKICVMSFWMRPLPYCWVINDQPLK